MGASIVSAITSGLAIVGNLASSLNTGFDALFVNGSGLTNVGTFAFILLGLGIAVGICKKVFNWITGRHGM